VGEGAGEGAVPSDRVRRMEVRANEAFDVYRELYYEGGVSSVYFWNLDDGFAGVVLLKKGRFLIFHLPPVVFVTMRYVLAWTSGLTSCLRQWLRLRARVRVLGILFMSLRPLIGRGRHIISSRARLFCIFRLRTTTWALWT
jgi:hypothetical protein